ncbi:hypothetical protein GLU60_03390 [Nanohaloarchaea archaeon H01]|nr:hypothetical protein [Nanohaloarchaea archaeon H01]
MVNPKLEKRIEESLQEGYTPEEIVKALREDGYSDDLIFSAVKNAEEDLDSGNHRNHNSKKLADSSSQEMSRNQNNRNQNTRPQNNETGKRNNSQRPSNNSKEIVPGVDLSDNQYTLKQRLLFNRYKLYDQDGGLVMKAKQKILKMKEDFRFKNSDDEEVMHVKAENIMDVAGDYTLMNNQDDPIAVLEKDWSFLHHKWKIREAGPDERLLAKISSRGGIDILRILGGQIPFVGLLVSFIPHKYDVKNGRDEQIGTIEGKIGIHDIYNIEINSGEIPQETMIASAVAIDALENN